MFLLTLGIFKPNPTNQPTAYIVALTHSAKFLSLVESYGMLLGVQVWLQHMPLELRVQWVNLYQHL
jgi:hypothetical protein